MVSKIAKLIIYAIIIYSIASLIMYSSIYTYFFELSNKNIEAEKDPRKQKEMIEEKKKERSNLVLFFSITTAIYIFVALIEIFELWPIFAILVEPFTSHTHRHSVMERHRY